MKPRYLPLIALILLPVAFITASTTDRDDPVPPEGQYKPLSQEEMTAYIILAKQKHPFKTLIGSTPCDTKLTLSSNGASATLKISANNPMVFTRDAGDICARINAFDPFVQATEYPATQTIVLYKNPTLVRVDLAQAQKCKLCCSVQ